MISCNFMVLPSENSMLLGAVIFAAVWCLIALLLRHYPETMAGYNTMPKAKREKIDIEKIGRLVSSVMFAGVPAGLLIGVAIYVNVCKKKFEK